MTNLTVRPDAGTKPLSPAGPPHHDRENAGAAGRGQQRKHPGVLPKWRDQRVRTGRRNHRRTADPVNEIVTSKTAAPQGPLRRRRRRWISAPWTTWRSGWRTRTTRPTPAPQSGQERTPPRTGARWASPRTSGASGQYLHDHPEIQRVASSSWQTPFSHVPG